MSDPIMTMLQESNAIEDVWDEASLLSAYQAWESLQTLHILTEEAILRAHRILMREKLPDMFIGAWRKLPVAIGGRLAPPDWEVPRLMDRWINACNLCLHFYRDNIQDRAQFREEAKRLHISFEHIHPFVDGNGRMGRILLNWLLVQLGEPIWIIYEREKWDYYAWF